MARSVPGTGSQRRRVRTSARLVAAAAPLAALALGTLSLCAPLVDRAGAAPGTSRTYRSSLAARRRRSTTAPQGGEPVDKSRFATGACESFAPTHGDVHHTVFLDAGHGSIDPGGQGVTETGTTIYEAPTNLDVELDTTRILRAAGFRVVVSRTASSEVARLTPADRTGDVLSVQGARADIAARDQCANMAGATALVGIYLDAGDTPANAGCLTAYDADRSFAAKSRDLATVLQRDVLAHLDAHGWQIPDDGVQPDTTLGGEPLTTTAAVNHHLLLLGPKVPGWFTTPSEMPGALIEPLFITDPFEGTIATSTAGRAAIAQGLAEGIEQYFGISTTGASAKGTRSSATRRAHR